MSNTERVQILGRMNVLLTQSSDLRHKFGALERPARRSRRAGRTP